MSNFQFHVNSQCENAVCCRTWWYHKKRAYKKYRHFDLQFKKKLLNFSGEKNRQPYIMYYRSVLHRPAESPKMNVSCLQLHFLEVGWCRCWYAFNGPYSKSENYFLQIIGTNLFATIRRISAHVMFSTAGSIRQNNHDTLLSLLLLWRGFVSFEKEHSPHMQCCQKAVFWILINTTQKQTEGKSMALSSTGSTESLGKTYSVKESFASPGYLFYGKWHI